MIPAALRNELGIEPGDDLQASIEDGRLVLGRATGDYLERLREAAGDLFKGVDVQHYIRELRDE